MKERSSVIRFSSMVMVVAFSLTVSAAFKLPWKDVTAVTGEDIVTDCQKRPKGYTQEQYAAIEKALLGRKLEFRGGQIGQAIKSGTAALVGANFGKGDLANQLEPHLYVEFDLEGPAYREQADKLMLAAKVTSLSGVVAEHISRKLGYPALYLKDVTLEMGPLEDLWPDMNPDTVTGADIIRESRKHRIDKVALFGNKLKQLAGKSLTFEDMVVEYASEPLTGKGRYEMAIRSAAGGHSIIVQCDPSDPLARTMELLNVGTKLKTVAGVASGCRPYLIIKATSLVPQKQLGEPFFKNPAQLTSAALIKDCAAADGGYTSLKRQCCVEAFKGRKVDFENAVVSVSCDGGSPKVNVEIPAAKPKRGFGSGLAVSVHFSDPQQLATALCLKKGDTLLKVSGTVSEGWCKSEFALKDSVIVPKIKVSKSAIAAKLEDAKERINREKAFAVPGQSNAAAGEAPVKGARDNRPHDLEDLLKDLEK